MANLGSWVNVVSIFHNTVKKVLGQEKLIIRIIYYI